MNRPSYGRNWNQTGRYLQVVLLILLELDFNFCIEFRIEKSDRVNDRGEKGGFSYSGHLGSNHVHLRKQVNPHRILTDIMRRKKNNPFIVPHMETPNCRTLLTKTVSIIFTHGHTRIETHYLNNLIGQIRQSQCNTFALYFAFIRYFEWTPSTRFQWVACSESNCLRAFQALGTFRLAENRRN